MEETFQSLRFSQRLLIITCASILSFAVLFQKKPNHFQRALAELNSISGTLNDIEQQFLLRKKRLSTEDAFLVSFRNDFSQHIDNNFEFELMPTKISSEEENDDGGRRYAIKESIPAPIFEYSLSGEKLESIYEMLDSYLNTYKEKQINEILPLISPQHDLAVIKEGLNETTKIIRLSTRLLREPSNSIRDSVIVFVVTVKEQKGPPKNRGYLFNAKLKSLNLKVDSIFIQSGLAKRDNGRINVLPSLWQFRRELWDLEIDEARRNLIENSANWEKINSDPFTIFGISIKPKGLFFFSPIIIIAVMIYFFATLKFAELHIEKEIQISPFPWMGFYSGALGKFLNITTTIILPAITCIVLLIKEDDISYFGISTQIIAICFILYLGTKTFRSINNINTTVKFTPTSNKAA